MMNSERIWRSPYLPTLPAAAVRLLELSKDPEVQFRRIVEVVRADPALSMRALQVANSAYFGVRGEITSLDRAVSRLGKTLITSLAMSFALVDPSLADGELRSHFHDYWRRTTVAAAAAEVLAELTGGDPAECFQAALLMDIGRLAMLRTLADEYALVLRRAADEQRELSELEQEALGFNHMEIGSRLSQRWSLPERLQLVIRWHNAPAKQWNEAALSAQELLRVAATAHWVAAYFCDKSKAIALARLRESAGGNFGLIGSSLDCYLEQAGQRAEQTAKLLRAPLEHLPSCAELLSEANFQLSQMIVRSQCRSDIAVRSELLECRYEPLRAASRELQDQAVVDPFNGIFNRCI